MTDLTFRPAQKSDIPTLLDLYHIFDGDAPGLSLAAAETIFARIETYPNYTVYLAEYADEIVGTFALLLMDNLAHQGMPEGIVENVVVAPQMQGQGFGKTLMQYAMQICADAGCYKLVLSSNVKNERAHKFYESLGFEKYGFSFRVEII